MLDNIEKAIITSGGVDLTEVSPKNFESKLVPNLYFAGEVLDIDALTGGFNLQIAFSSGFVVGDSVRLHK
jgi:predicted flavoprotein YhiN